MRHGNNQERSKELYSDSSTAASTRKSTNPMAMPASVRALMIGTMRKISEATSMFAAKAPPRDARPLHAALTLAKASSVLCVIPMRVTGFNPSKFFSFRIANGLDDDRRVEATASEGATTAAIDAEVMVAAAIAKLKTAIEWRARERERARVRGIE